MLVTDCLVAVKTWLQTSFFSPYQELKHGLKYSAHYKGWKPAPLEHGTWSRTHKKAQ